jgi:hypothetical protein
MKSKTTNFSLNWKSTPNKDIKYSWSDSCYINNIELYRLYYYTEKQMTYLEDLYEDILYEIPTGAKAKGYNIAYKLAKLMDLFNSNAKVWDRIKEKFKIITENKEEFNYKYIIFEIDKNIDISNLIDLLVKYKFSPNKTNIKHRINVFKNNKLFLVLNLKLNTLSIVNKIQQISKYDYGFIYNIEDIDKIQQILNKEQIITEKIELPNKKINEKFLVIEYNFNEIISDDIVSLLYKYNFFNNKDVFVKKSIIESQYIINEKNESNIYMLINLEQKNINLLSFKELNEYFDKKDFLILNKNYIKELEIILINI